MFYSFTFVSFSLLVPAMFHVASLMPSIEADPMFLSKKRHIGNDYVHIVFNESGSLVYDLDTVTARISPLVAMAHH